MKDNPLKKYFQMLQLDRKDIIQVIFYAIFAGLVSLSLPLGIQAIITLIQSGQVSVSWIVLVVVVVMGVALVGILTLMQLRITENIQQKIFVRSSFEFAYRFPKIQFEALYNEYPPELANRFFDTLTIQKGTSKLLLDYSSALLQIVFGVLLLSLYHPFFIVFGLFLLLLLYSIFKFSFNSGVSTSLNESKYKYKVAAWLQEVARNNTSFKKQSHFDYALTKNDNLVENYLNYREKHFGIIKRQFSQLIIFKVIITAGLLSIGGFLVLNQQMNIGQFVAAEIVILTVINSVEKIIVGLETFYDVLTSVEKISQVVELQTEKLSDINLEMILNEITLETENLEFKYPNSNTPILKEINLKIEPCEKIVLNGINGSGKTTLIRILSGLLKQTSGSFYINDATYRKINLQQYRQKIGVIIQGETPFEGTILENIACNNPSVTAEDVKWAIEKVQLDKFVKTLTEGLQSKVFAEGRQLSSSNAQKILLARSIVTRPKILFLEDPLDRMDDEISHQLIDFLTHPDNPWSIIVSSRNPYWIKKCTRVITMQQGTILKDIKN